MSGKAGLKAGLIGAAVALVLTLLAQIPLPFVCCGCTMVTWLVYAGAGVLGGVFLPPPRNAGSGAGAGAIAGLISGLVSGLIWIVVLIIQMLISGTADIMQSLDPQTIQQIRELGWDPATVAWLSGGFGIAIVSGGCCLTNLAVGAGLGAVGGVIFGAAKPD
jgi:hypothetical protein